MLSNNAGGGGICMVTPPSRRRPGRHWYVVFAIRDQTNLGLPTPG
jgi:hypothetical protein